MNTLSNEQKNKASLILLNKFKNKYDKDSKTKHYDEQTEFLDSVSLFYKEAGYSQYDRYFEARLEEIDQLTEDLSSVNRMQPE